MTATYRLRCSADEAPRLAQHIALEQTVEIPEELIDSPELREAVVGRVRSVTPCADRAETFLAVIDYPADLAGAHASQLWNLLYGNISLKRHVRLVDLKLPAALQARYRGPRFGIAGARKLLGVEGRPLLATALKPRGSSPSRLAELAAAFAAGGGDIVKDDHNLVDPDFETFRRRVELCQSAVETARTDSSRVTLYAPNLSVPLAELDRAAEFLVRRGVKGALIAPMLLGFETVQRLTATYPLVWMAHPTFSGCYFHDPDHGVDPAILLGQWFRLIGCDATIFPNHGGRFTFTETECADIANAARRADGDVVPCWPAPAGGMSFERLPEMAAAYGADAMFLIGGALLGASSSLQASTQRFGEQIAACFPQGRHVTPLADEHFSACEMTLPQSASATTLEHLAFQTGFRWDGRSAVAYKQNGTLPFKDVARTELIGRHGEQTAFDVRYFEIAPGGYSSLEKHAHTHVVIGLRGTGVLDSRGEQRTINPFDIGYVPPLAVHQLHNRGDEPFGFLCIVDHDRDRPQAP
ncbi:MAG TPA: RuBisCO large subunit C-terminal-like domain-containing protein [Planctomycetaceae bacterium]|nr:RuBisCO large subunit C-terminal-like domain-containing protein [Planctomycetaceae bacterium]